MCCSTRCSDQSVSFAPCRQRSTRIRRDLSLRSAGERLPAHFPRHILLCGLSCTSRIAQTTSGLTAFWTPASVPGQKARRPCHDLTRNPGTGHTPSSRTPERPGRIPGRHPCTTAPDAGDGMDPGYCTKRELAHDHHTPAPPRFLAHTSTVKELSFAHGTVQSLFHTAVPGDQPGTAHSSSFKKGKRKTVTGSSSPVPPVSAGREAMPHRPPQVPCRCSQHRISSRGRGS